MKRKFLIVLSLVLMLGLMACDKDAEKTNTVLPSIPQNEIPTTIAYANWIDSEVAFESDENCLNTDKYVFSDFPRLPTFKFDTKLELDEFKNKYKDVFTMNQGYNEVASFNEVTANYDDEFFNNYSLILTYKEVSSGSFRYGITDVKKENGTLNLMVDKLNNPEVCTDDMVGWLLMAEVEKEYIKDCTFFDTQDWEGYSRNALNIENDNNMEKLEENHSTDNENLYDISVQYLIDNNDDPEQNKDGYKMFVDYNGFGITKDSEYRYVYMWIAEESYYVVDNKIVSGSGSSMPYKFTLELNKDKVVKYDIPKDGNEYTSSIKEMYPDDIENEAINYRWKDDKLIKEVKEYYSDLADKSIYYYTGEEYIKLDK